MTDKQENNYFRKIAKGLSKGLCKQISKAMEHQLEQCLQDEIYNLLVEVLSKEKVEEMLKQSSPPTIHLVEALKPEAKDKVISAIISSIEQIKEKGEISSY
ncbi:hypothetical protein [Thermoflavimicrobium dichotomicum]|uniref:Uncharacterized protein n=1 Tax=Thermoflavimicrobium dichotomicum TaxID=46223 RepID=A0A1I3PM10_9BACL|nr:hypothetical protein [Thermoflavimicrobium dichotomicum]SFJ22341.1 hypothetical protein SAMN05421852_10621 [Thermoflavimicrobium dichotomicum]